MDFVLCNKGHSVVQGIRSPWNIDLTLFYIALPLKKNQNLSDPSLYEQHLIEKLEKFKNCKEVKHMIMIVAVIYIFLILCDIWSAVEN